MSISNELTSEIVVALLGSGDKSRQELNRLRELASTVHRTLGELERGARAARERSRKLKEERRWEIINSRMEP